MHGVMAHWFAALTAFTVEPEVVLSGGDLVAVRDWDATHYTGYRDGGVTVGVVACGDSPLAGNGPAVTVLLSAGDGSLEPELAPDANLAAMLGLG